MNSYTLPNEKGQFGIYGGRFVPETLMKAVLELDEAYKIAKADPSFQAEIDGYLSEYVGRETPLYLATKSYKTRWRCSNIP